MKDSKINNDRKPLTEKEIQAAEDFQDVMNRYKATQPGFFKKYGVYIGVAIILGIVTLFVLPDNTVEEPSQPEITNNTITPENTSVITPPLKGLDVDISSNIVNAIEGAELTFPSGTVVKIPPHSFLDAEGNPLEGDVELRFREFHDLAEIFASGIPMTYDSAGVEYHFESAGMFEIDAFQNGEKVLANPNAPIIVELASNQHGDHYNLYFLDNEGTWHFIAKDTAHGSGANVNNLDLAEVPDKIKQLEKQQKNLKKEIDKSTKALEKLIDGKLIPEPRLANDDLYSFVLDTKKDEFPELEYFKNVLFEVTEENKDFSSEMMQLEWDDMVMKKHQKTGYKMTLYRNSQKETLFVRPVFSKATIGEAQKQYQQLFDEYDLTLGGKLSEEKMKRDSLKQSFRAIADSVDQLNYYISDEYQRQLAIGNTISKVTRVFEVDQFGFFNSDCPQNLPKGREIEPLFVDLKKISDTLSFTNIYLAELDNNTMYTIWGYWGEQQEGEEKVWVAPTVSYNPNNKTVMWGVTSENKLAVFKPEQFEQLAKGGEVDLSMNISSKKVTDLDELRKLLGMI